MASIILVQLKNNMEILEVIPKVVTPQTLIIVMVLYTVIQPWVHRKNSDKSWKGKSNRTIIMSLYLVDQI